MLRKIFATNEIPERVESGNGPSFNSADFKTFAEEIVFKHYRATPEHPRANEEAESFMKVLNRTGQIAHNEGRSGCIEILDYLECIMSVKRNVANVILVVTVYRNGRLINYENRKLVIKSRDTTVFM